MMKKITVSILAAAVTLVFTCPVFAADEYKDSKKQTSKMEQQQSGSSQSAKELMGMDVVTQQGEEVAEIQDIRLDIQSGKISYVILSKGGVLGIGDEGIAVPVEALQFSPGSDQVTLNVEQSKLDNAPKQANKSDEEFTRELQSHYGVSPAFQQQQQQQQSPQMKSDQQKQKDKQEKGTN
jgi:sporulation protein YlmC with PRC-barrel domain